SGGTQIARPALFVDAASLAYRPRRATRGPRDRRDTRGSPRLQIALAVLSGYRRSGEHGVERGDEPIVLRRRAERRAQASLATGPHRDVTDEHALLEEPRVHVRGLPFAQAEEDEVRDRRKDVDR